MPLCSQRAMITMITIASMITIITIIWSHVVATTTNNQQSTINNQQSTINNLVFAAPPSFQAFHSTETLRKLSRNEMRRWLVLIVSWLIFRPEFTRPPSLTGLRWGGLSNEYPLHPGRLTWNLKMMVWMMMFLFNWVVFRFHVNYIRCIL